MSQYAKAIAAVVTPLVVWAITWLADNAGIAWVPDPIQVETIVVGLIGAVAVFFAPRNTEKPAGE